MGSLLLETSDQLDKITRRNAATRLLKASGDEEKLKGLEKRLEQMSQRAIYQILVSLVPLSEGWGRYCFRRCLCVHREGRGYPIPGQVGVPSTPARSGQEGGTWQWVLHCDIGRIPSARSGWGKLQDTHDHVRLGYPEPGQGYPTMGYPQPGQVGYRPLPGTEQQSKHLIQRGWYASCIHAGGLSC